MKIFNANIVKDGSQVSILVGKDQTDKILVFTVEELIDLYDKKVGGF